jgi:hypothetical protein
MAGDHQRPAVVELDVPAQQIDDCRSAALARRVGHFDFGRLLEPFDGQMRHAAGARSAMGVRSGLCPREFEKFLQRADFQ